MSDAYFVDGLWPKKRLNLVCGSSGAGKTRWMLPQLIELKRKGVKVLYTCCDRTIEDAQDTMSEMGFDPTELPTVSFMSVADSEWTPDGLYALTAGIEHDLLFVETIGALCENIMDMHKVLKFGRRINNYMKLSGASVWGSSWCPKTKEGEKFVRTRDNVMGSAAWPGISGTIVYIEATERGSSEREVTIMPRSGPERLENYRFNESGVLEKFTPPSFELLLAEGGMIYRSDVISMAEAMGLKGAEKAANRWVAAQLDKGVLKRIKAGEYLVL